MAQEELEFAVKWTILATCVPQETPAANPQGATPSTLTSSLCSSEAMWRLTSPINWASQLWWWLLRKGTPGGPPPRTSPVGGWRSLLPKAPVGEGGRGWWGNPLFPLSKTVPYKEQLSQSSADFLTKLCDVEESVYKCIIIGEEERLPFNSILHRILYILKQLVVGIWISLKKKERWGILILENELPWWVC